MNPNSPCPGKEELQKLIDGSLMPQRQEECLPHLENCSGCQMTLESLATGDSNLSEIVRLAEAAVPQATSAYWPALRAASQSPYDIETLDGKAIKPKRELALDFLEPANDPVYLGRLDHFEVMRTIGRGGMGVVLEAFDSHLQRNVALKVLDPEYASDDAAKTRFCREARHAASISHENVVTVHQVMRAQNGKLPFLVMQLISGETLEQRIAREKKLPLKEIIRIGMQAARGLAAAHAQGLVHRDIKPANMLLEPPEGRVKLTDFGLARVAEDLKLTRTGFVAGTPLYMAPEQARGEATDARSDLFGLGAILYEMTTGQTPFRGNSALEVLHKITEVKHPPVREIEPSAPEWLAELIDELLAKKPEDRYQSATDLAEVLEFHWTHLKTSSGELPNVCQVELRQRRKRNTIIMGISAVALVAVGLLAGMLLPFGRMPGVSSSSAPPLAVLSANAGAVWSVGFDVEGESLAMGVEDGTIRLWDVSKASVKATLEAHGGTVWQTEFFPRSEMLATGGDDGLLKIWSLSQSEPLKTFEHPNAVRGLAIAPDEKVIYTGDRKGGLHAWSLEKPEELMKTDQPGAIYTVKISNDGQTLATAGSDKIIRLWNAATLKQKLPLTGHAGPIFGVSFDAEGKRLASAGWDKIVRIWDTSSGQLLKSWTAHPGDIWAVAFSPDGKHIATGGMEGAVKIWNAESGELEETFLGHESTIHCLSFSRDGKQLSSGARDGSARIWDLK
jgi:serine/threonine protein kinase